MMTKIWMRGIVAGLGLAVVANVALAQQRTPAPNQPQNVEPGDLSKLGEIREMPGPFDSPRDVQDTLKMLFIAADTNNDGLISKKEATDAANMTVGGLFFRADDNGDGKVTQQEAQKIREEVLNRQPVMRLFVQEIRRGGAGSQQNPFKGIADLLDANNDASLQGAEVKQAVATGVDAFYGVADTNRDGQMSPGEMNAAAIGLARAAGEWAFKAADQDNNGSVSQAEFEKAIVEPARVVFGVVDANNDGQITLQEAERAQRYTLSRMQIAVPDASDSNAPIPNFASPTQPGAAPARPRARLRLLDNLRAQ